MKKSCRNTPALITMSLGCSLMDRQRWLPSAGKSSGSPRRSLRTQHFCRSGLSASPGRQASLRVFMRTEGGNAFFPGIRETTEPGWKKRKHPSNALARNDPILHPRLTSKPVRQAPGRKSERKMVFSLAFPAFFIHVALAFFHAAWYNKVVIPQTLHQQHHKGPEH